MSYDHLAMLHGPRLSRRATLAGMGAALTLARIRPAAAAVSFPQRLLVLNIIGGLDGLSAVVPYGDPSLVGLRAPLIPPAVGQPGGMFDLGGFYGLNPSLPNLYALYQAGQLLPVHAVGNLVNVRSHFLGQDVLQLGTTLNSTSGWINRLVGLLPTVSGGVEAGVTMGSNVPTSMIGPALTGGFQTSSYPGTPNTLAALVETLGAPDPLIGYPTESGFADRAAFQGWLKGTSGGASPLQLAMRQAGTFLASPGGPAVAVVTTESVDTHTSQVSRLSGTLADIDAGTALFAAATGAAWSNTVMLTMTEFGRTAYVNGCGGTDHGTGFAMFLAGGAVKGGRVVADWPGLAPSQLVDQRDLAGSTDIRAVIMGVLQDHMGLSAASLATVFPGASAITPMSGLVS